MSDIKTDSVIKFGNYDWLVLDVQGGSALIITNNIIERREYNVKNKKLTWEKCTLRKYLNSEFLKNFSDDEQKRIIETRISNNNIWVDTKGGKDTSDKIFILSLEDADKYFGNTGDYQSIKRINGYGEVDIKGIYLSNHYNNLRIAKFNNEASDWWLRSPGIASDTAVIIERKGHVFTNGGALNCKFGIRPALWMRL